MAAPPDRERTAFVMTSAKAVFGAIAGRFLFTRSTVDRVVALERFRRIELSGAALRDVG